MEKFDNETLLGYLDSYFEKTYNDKNIKKAPIEKWDAYIKSLADENNVYANTLLAIIYYEGEITHKDNDQFLYYLDLASKQGSPIAYACLAVCYHYGFIVNKNMDESSKFLKKYNKTLSGDSLDLGAFAFFRNLLNEAGDLSMKDIAILFCDYYIELFKYYEMRINDEVLLSGIELNVKRYSDMAIAYGDKNTNFKLYDFYRHFVFDDEKAMAYLKHAALDDKNEDAIELYENLN